MQLKLEDDFGHLLGVLKDYYATAEYNFRIFHAELSDDVSVGGVVRYILNGKFVVEYRIFVERGVKVGSISLGIGPHYFLPFQFADAKHAGRFTLEFSGAGVIKNLDALNCWLGLQNKAI